MPTDEARLLKLAEAVADGFGVDWPDAESSTHDPAQRDLVRNLRVLADLADLHRGAAPEAAAAAVLPERHASVDRTARIDRSFTSWGPLEIRAKVGSGTFGAVYRAWDARLDREVAVKFLDGMRSTEQDFASNVVDEARVLARLRHPNVVTIFGADCFDNQVGLWMEFVNGRTLKEIQREQGPFSAREAMLIGLDLCHALAAVHKAGFLHRDIKAQNVMRETGGRIVLMDFGAAAVLLPRSDKGARLAGTPLYLAPEVLQGDPPTVRTDLYSLGILLFYLVSGAFPVTGESLQELCAAHERQKRRLLRDMRPDLPSAFVRVIDNAIAVSPDPRPDSAGAFEALLEAAIGLGEVHTAGSAPADEEIDHETGSLLHGRRGQPTATAIVPAGRPLVDRMRPVQHYAMTRDGVRITYAVHGDGPPLVFVRGWVSHLDFMWDDQRFRSYMQCLGRQFRVYRYDARGNGLSERVVKKITLDALLLDLEALVDQLDANDFVLYGSTFGGPIAIAYAARHPQRVRKIILEGSYAQGKHITTSVRKAFVINALRVFPEAAFLLLSYATNPGADNPEYRRPELMHQMITPATAAQFYSLGFAVDVAAEASRVEAPALVLHRQESHSIPFNLGKELAALIPHATFAALPGEAHNAWEGDPLSALKEIERFLGVDLLG
jgi:pimeloyl-ACP methyl ester carboxylesterase